MRSRIARYGRLLIAAALLTGLVLSAAAGPASAATTTVRLAGGSTTITLTTSTARTLRRLGVHVSARSPAHRRGGAYAFPISGGRIDPTTAAGTIDHRGGLTLRAGRVRLVLRSFTIAGGRLSVRAGGSRVTLARLDLRRAVVSRSGFGTVVSRVRIVLTHAGARALNRAFHVRVFRSGRQLARATVNARAAEAALSGGQTAVTFNSTALAAFGALHIGVTATGGATLTGATLTLPISGGTLNLTTKAGTISHTGGFTLSRGSTALPITDLAVVLGATPQLTVTAGTTTNAPMADLDLSAATTNVDANTRQIAVSGVSLKLTAVAAATLNSVFSTTAFTGGTVFATATVTAQAR